MNMQPTSKFIYIIGTGQIAEKHLTLEGVNVCRSADKLLLIDGNPKGVLSTIGGHHNYEDIMALYIDGAIDAENYARIVSKIVDDISVFDSVAVTTAGHPLVGVSWWEDLREKLHGSVSIRYIEGISSLTSIFVALNVDPLERGCAIVDANRLLIFDQAVNVENDLVVFNFCSTGTRRTYLSNPARDNLIVELRDHLLKFYPSNWKIRMVSAPHLPASEPDIIETSVSDLVSILPKIKFYSSLFIEGLERNRLNVPFVRKLLDLPAR